MNTIFLGVLVCLCGIAASAGEVAPSEKGLYVTPEGNLKGALEKTAAFCDSLDAKCGSGCGRFVDPKGDCSVKCEGAAIVITVPGSANPHDMACEIGNTDAPRVVQTVTGDFVAQVKVSGKAKPGDDSTQANRAGYNGAGLVMYGDDENFITLVRATMHHSGDQARGYVNFEVRSEGKLVRIGLASDRSIDGNAPLHLRLERKGQDVSGAISEDGMNWEALEPKVLHGSWPSKSEVGVIGVSTSRQPFEPRFDGLQITQAGTAVAAKCGTTLDLAALRAKLPEHITSVTKEDLVQRMPHFYYFVYEAYPQPGKRYWLRIDDETWIERYPDGLESTFKVLGRTKVAGQTGTLVVKVSGSESETATMNDGGLQAFIPDRGSPVMHHWYRNHSRGDTQWNDLAPMNAVE